jgi:hypothetical protein
MFGKTKTIKKIKTPNKFNSPTPKAIQHKVLAKLDE